jgi:phenol hydroxylase P1 protein
MNNSAMCANGYGAALTQPCMYQAMDQLGIAQYLTRLGLMLASPEALSEGKADWMNGASWQTLRHYVEDSLVMEDWFEQFVAQNLVLDGLLYPLAYEYFDQALAEKSGATISMMTRFQREWFMDASRWVDSVIKVAASESAENQQLLSSWIGTWLARAVEALAPVATLALGDDATEAMDELAQEFKVRLGKLGVAI